MYRYIAKLDNSIDLQMVRIVWIIEILTGEPEEGL